MVKIIIDDAPVNQAFADENGADGFAPDAGAASKMAKVMYAQQVLQKQHVL